MIAVITGDIIGSRALPKEWLNTLKSTLGALIDENAHWEIFRGDSFQIELSAENALLNAIYIKTCLKTLKKADVRIGIGIGQKSFSAAKVSEANGEAFVNSGLAFDSLKQNKSNMAIKSQWQNFDEEMNLYLRLALIAMDSWGTIAAETVKYAIENRDTNQHEIAKITGRSQSSVSEALKRAHFTDVMDLETKYRNRIQQLIK